MDFSVVTFILPLASLLGVPALKHLLNFFLSDASADFSSTFTPFVRLYFV